MAKQGSVALKTVVLVIPRGVEEKAMLEGDLRKMGCHGLMQRPWCIKYEKIVQELQQKQDNRWHGTVRQDADKWMAVALRKVYSFLIRGEGMATRGEKYAEGKFAHPPHPKDRHSLPECKDPRARRLLEFFVSTFYLENPAKVIVTVGNTIFEAYTSEQDVDWALVMRDTIRRLLTGIGKSKPTPICSYVLHL